MKILVSAYACRPGIGSEPAVGWNWVLEYAKLCQLVVLTNYTNKSYIEAYQQSHTEELKSVRFVYVKPNAKTELWYKEWERLERLYYVLWQKKAIKIAKEICKIEKFDYVQHITYVSCVMPTYMYKLDIPFIYGPVSGGESIPKVINYPFSKKEKLIESIRTVTQRIAKRSKNFYRCCEKAKYIVAVTNETKEMVPVEYQSKVIVTQAIGLNKTVIAETEKIFHDRVTKFLIAGRMLSWKGFKIGLEAFINVLKEGVNAELTVLGTGNNVMKDELQRMCGKYLGQRIHFIESVSYDKMARFYDMHDVLLNCSLRDSGCLVVMEAMGRGLPVICIDLGGPKVNTENGGAIKIPAQKYDILCNELSNAIKLLTENHELQKKLSQESRTIAFSNFEYAQKIQRFYKKYLRETS